MFGTKKKKEDEFFVALQEFAAIILEATEEFEDLVDNYVDLERKAVIIKEFESKCDQKTHDILTMVNESFVTPFDREDMHSIVKKMDDIVDKLEHIANRFLIFDVKTLKPGCQEITDLIVLAVKEIVVLFEHLPEVKKNNKVKQQIIEINRIENEGDLVNRRNLQELFTNEKDPIEVIKWKHIYEQLEGCLDSCESVTDIVEGVVIKYV